MAIRGQQVTLFMKMTPNCAQHTHSLRLLSPRGRKGRLKIFVSHAAEMDLACERGSVRVEVFRRRDSNVTTRTVPVEGGTGEGAAATKCSARFEQELALEVFIHGPRTDVDLGRC